MRPYPRYRDSGVEWLGEVPEALGRSPTAEPIRLFEARSGGTPSTAEEAYWEGDIPSGLCQSTSNRALRISC